jgi:ribosomal protein S18 acetylase RimI-like enzyme
VRYEIISFDNSKHRDQVIALWNEVFGYEAIHNAPDLVIDKKIEFGDGLFFVTVDKDNVIGTVLAGYDGHRGWIYSLAISPAHRNKGLGSKLLRFAEERLTERGCVKVNLQIKEGNETVESFYRSNSYRTEKRISMGKRLKGNI